MPRRYHEKLKKLHAFTNFVLIDPEMTKASHQHSGNEHGNCGFRMFNMDNVEFPILVSVPHAGREYPDTVHEYLRIAPRDLIRLEDRYADRLVQPLIAQGIPTIIATRARAWIDLNRSVDELDPEMVLGRGGSRAATASAKMRGGLGLIPRRLIQCGDIWKRPFSAEDIQDRIDAQHDPYHRTIATYLGELREKFGSALLIDVHSMPPLASIAGVQPNIVVGDRFGQSAGSIFAEILMERLKQAGVTAALNHPYPGDYILRRHGNVRNNIHAIQIEVDRSLYLDSDLLEPANQLGSTASLLSGLIWSLIDVIGGTSLPMAAE